MSRRLYEQVKQHKTFRRNSLDKKATKDKQTNSKLELNCMNPDSFIELLVQVRSPENKCSY